MPSTTSKDAGLIRSDPKSYGKCRAPHCERHHQREGGRERIMAKTPRLRPINNPIAPLTRKQRAENMAAQITHKAPAPPVPEWSVTLQINAEQVLAISEGLNCLYKDAVTGRSPAQFGQIALSLLNQLLPVTTQAATRYRAALAAQPNNVNNTENKRVSENDSQDKETSQG